MKKWISWYMTHGCEEVTGIVAIVEWGPLGPKQSAHPKYKSLGPISPKHQFFLGDHFVNRDMSCKIFFLLATAMIARAAILPVVPVKNAIPSYSFGYDIQDSITGDSKAQYETRNGPIVQGSYSLIDPDNTRRTVHYTADDLGGFRAVVLREPIALAPKAPLLTTFPIAPTAQGPEGSPKVPSTGPDSDVEVVDLSAETLAKSSNGRFEAEGYSDENPGKAQYKAVPAPSSPATKTARVVQRIVAAPISSLNYPATAAYTVYRSPLAYAVQPDQGLTYTVSLQG